jgi:hypothetical protein
MGWKMDAIISAFAIAPDSWIENTYYNDIIVNNAVLCNAFVAAQGATYQDTCAWNFAGGERFELWELCFLTGVLPWAYYLTEDSDVQTWAINLGKFPIGLADGDWISAVALSCTELYYRNSNVQPHDTSTYLGWDEIGQRDALDITASHVTMVAATKILTVANTLLSMTLEDDAQVLFIPDASLPSGITTFQWYYCINVSGNSFQISETPSPGSAVAVGDGTYTARVYWRPHTSPSSISYNTADDYLSIACGALATMKAFGFDVSTAYTNASAYQTANYNLDPRWKTQTTL